MSVIRCVVCREEIDLSEDRYSCRECTNYNVCSRCYEDEESEISHEHKLHRVRGTILPKRLYTYRDPRSGKSLILTNCAGVLPGSEILCEAQKESTKKMNGTAKAVLTLLDFGPICPKTDDLEEIEVIDSEEEEEEESIDDSVDEVASGRQSSLQKEETLLSKYAYGGGTVRSSIQNGVLYHLVRLRDVSNPDMLDSGFLSRAAAEATVFISRALKYCGGDVVVHCYLGVRRSPTMFAAWLATQNLTVDTALRMIGAEHANIEKWDVEYKRLRPEWVAWLRWWRSNWKVIQETWIYNHTNEIQGWNRMFAQISGKEIVDEEINEIIEERKREHTTVIPDDEEEDEDEDEDEDEGSEEESDNSDSDSDDDNSESESSDDEGEEDENEEKEEVEINDEEEIVVVKKGKKKAVSKPSVNAKKSVNNNVEPKKQDDEDSESESESELPKNKSRRVIDDDEDEDEDKNEDKKAEGNNKNENNEVKPTDKKEVEKEKKKMAPPPEKKARSNLTFKYTDGEPSKVQSSLMSFFTVKKK